MINDGGRGGRRIASSTRGGGGMSSYPEVSLHYRTLVSVGAVGVAATTDFVENFLHPMISKKSDLVSLVLYKSAFYLHPQF